VDGEGLVVEGLGELDVAAVLVTPAHQFPHAVLELPDHLLESELLFRAERCSIGLHGH